MEGREDRDVEQAGLTNPPNENGAASDRRAVVVFRSRDYSNESRKNTSSTPSGVFAFATRSWRLPLTGSMTE